MRFKKPADQAWVFIFLFLDARVLAEKWAACSAPVVSPKHGRRVTQYVRPTIERHLYLFEVCYGSNLLKKSVLRQLKKVQGGTERYQEASFLFWYGSHLFWYRLIYFSTYLLVSLISKPSILVLWTILICFNHRKISLFYWKLIYVFFKRIIQCCLQGTWNSIYRQSRPLARDMVDPFRPQIMS